MSINVCYICKVRLKKNEGTLHILPSLPSGSQRRRICPTCHVRFHEGFNSFNSKYSKKYLKRIRALTFNQKRLENMKREDKSYSDYFKENF